MLSCLPVPFQSGSRWRLGLGFNPGAVLPALAVCWDVSSSSASWQEGSGCVKKGNRLEMDAVSPQWEVDVVEEATACMILTVCKRQKDL